MQKHMVGNTWTVFSFDLSAWSLLHNDVVVIVPGHPRQISDSTRTVPMCFSFDNCGENRMPLLTILHPS